MNINNEVILNSIKIDKKIIIQIWLILIISKFEKVGEGKGVIAF